MKHKIKTSAPPELRLERCDIVVETGAQFLVLSFPTLSGRQECRLPREKLTDHRKVEAEITRYGSLPISDLKARCVELLMETPPKTTRTTGVTGWYGKALVTRSGTYGQVDSADPIQFEPTNAAARGPGKKKSRSLWKAEVREVMGASTYLTFFVTAGLAPALADYIGRTGAYAFALSQLSSVGKSLTSRAVQSVSRAANETDLETLNKTDGKAVQSLLAFGGECVAFGDIKSSPLKGRELVLHLQTVVFGAYDGSQRQTLASIVAPNPRFSILLLTAERPIRDLFESAKVPFEDGDAVRLIDIPVPDRSAGGIFDMPSTRAPVELARDTDQAISRCYGTSLPRWAARLVALDPEQLSERVRELEQQFIASLGPLDPLEARLAKPFALVAAVGVLAARTRTLPCSKAQVLGAARLMFNRARSRLERSPVEMQHSWHVTLRNVAETLPRATAGTAADPVACTQGFVRKVDGRDFVYLREEVLLRIAGSREELRLRMLADLEAAGVLKRYKGGGFSTPTAQKGLARRRYSRLDMAKLMKVGSFGEKA